MKKRECPSCAMEVEVNNKVCPICGYEFPGFSPAMRWIAILLAVALLLTGLVSILR
ncbi:MAG: hypothetical protein KIT62_09790 [Cyclobacteriaceae bacterium]|nr:hypothetical protein [Cyclobacteriaceae bacterium]